MTELTKDLLKIISETAIKLNRADELKKQEEKHDRRIRNIRLLLKNYRALVLHSERIKDDLDCLDETSIHHLDVYTISLESIESIMKSQKKTVAMIEFVNDKINAYKKSCNKEELKYFKVLEMKYITPEKYSAQEIAERINVDRTTVSRYLSRAVDDLHVIIFGIEALQFER
ncbi:HTH domain-containing protein [Amphibacillus marinus]|uniref:HTH domain-containing protein n=1 Tax=Amphibacillus marinus TaxID=872970 RepID=A0A1H8IZD3_9BACI|nr:HTH domain-containing protein [Amphibacillus marinus]SEN73801.1 HTH domain-containing protein [Amphibacillus marinus]